MADCVHVLFCDLLCCMHWVQGSHWKCLTSQLLHGLWVIKHTQTYQMSYFHAQLVCVYLKKKKLKHIIHDLYYPDTILTVNVRQLKSGAAYLRDTDEEWVEEIRKSMLANPTYKGAPLVAIASVTKSSIDITKVSSIHRKTDLSLEQNTLEFQIMLYVFLPYI